MGFGIGGRIGEGGRKRKCGLSTLVCEEEEKKERVYVYLFSACVSEGGRRKKCIFNHLHISFKGFGE